MTNTSPENDDDRTPTDEIPTGPTDETPTGPTDESAASRPASLVAAVVEHETRHDECTLYPADADDDALVTEWITAEEGSYVELDSMR